MEEKKKNIIAYIISTIIFLSGAICAIFLVYNNASRPVNNNPKKDTVFVSLLNQPYIQAPYTNYNNYNNYNTIPAEKQGNNNQGGRRATTNYQLHLKPQTGRWLRSNTPIKIDITGIGKEIASDVSYAYFKNQFKSFRFIGGVLAGLMILFASFFTKKEKYVNAEANDEDPPEIEHLFNNVYKEKIGLFRNPRKILRFKNTIRYHNYFLKANDITDSNSLKKLMLILLGIQNDPSLIDASNIKPTELSKPDWFYNKLQNQPWFEEAGINLKDDEKLMMTILKLNVDMGS